MQFLPNQDTPREPARAARLLKLRPGWPILTLAPSMRTFVALAFCLIVCLPAVAGTIVGEVRAEGVTPQGGGGGGGAYGSRRYKFVERVDYDRLTDFVVYIDQTVPGAPGAPSEPIAVVTQQDAKFEPRVLPVVVGTTVSWPNRDDIYHNVFSLSDAASFDLGMYRGDDETKRYTFDKPGRVDVFCAIHSNMHCIVLVLPSPYFSRSDERGRYEIRNVPAGTYRLRAWHERVPAKVQEIVVPPDGEVRMDFVLGFAATEAR